MKKNDDLMQNTLLLSLGTFITKGINLIMIPLFSRWLSTEDYGAFDLLCTYISLLLPFITMSSSEAIFRFTVDKTNKMKKSVYITNGLAIDIFNSVIVIVALSVIKFINGWEMAVPFIILLVVQTIGTHLQGFLRGIKKLNIYSLSSAVSTVFIVFSVTIFILVYNMGLKGMIYGYAAGYSVGWLIIILWSKYWEYVKIKSISIPCIKEMIQYSYALIPNNIAWWIINVSDRTFISIFLGAVANGIYAIAYKIPNFCASIFNLFSISWQQAATEMADDSERDSYYNHIYNKTVSVIISLCGGLLALNFFLFHYVFDMRYFEAKMYAPILITAGVFNSLTQYFGGIQISLKRSKENGITTIIGAAINIIINLALIQLIGLYAAAVSTLIANIAVTVIRNYQLKKEIDFKMEKSTRGYMGIYMYLFLMCYLSDYVVIACINLLVSIGLFYIINKDFIIKMFSKIFKMVLVKKKQILN
jgi:O-antigen/teichoic acid export membrane protein